MVSVVFVGVGAVSSGCHFMLLEFLFVLLLLLLLLSHVVVS